MSHPIPEPLTRPSREVVISKRMVVLRNSLRCAAAEARAIAAQTCQHDIKFLRGGVLCRRCGRCGKQRDGASEWLTAPTLAIVAQSIEDLAGSVHARARSLKTPALPAGGGDAAPSEIKGRL